jgi:hypothetical protein
MLESVMRQMNMNLNAGICNEADEYELEYLLLHHQHP